MNLMTCSFSARKDEGICERAREMEALSFKSPAGQKPIHVIVTPQSKLPELSNVTHVQNVSHYILIHSIHLNVTQVYNTSHYVSVPM